MGDTDEIVAAVNAHPGATSTAIRDVLRAAGRVSITIADVERVLRQRSSTTGSMGHDDRNSPGDGGDARVHRPGNGNWRRGPRSGASLPVLYSWQVDALDAWTAQHRRGVVEAVTGTGKTMIGLRATIDELGRGGQAVILVPTRELLHQWTRALEPVVPAGTRIGLLGDGHRDSLGQRDVLVAIVNSAAAAARDLDLCPRRPGGLLVGDECHRYGSERNRLALVEHFPHRLGLSATFERADDGHLTWLEPFFGPTCFTMDFRRAIDDGVTARFLVALAGVQLDPAEYGLYEELSDLMSASRAKLINRYHVPAEPIGAFLEAVGALARHGDDDAATVARSYLWAMSDRRRLLAETPAKRRLLHDLIPALRASDRAIVFTQSIAAAVDAATIIAGHGVAAAAIHSGLPAAERRDVLDRFAEGRLHVVAAPQVLDEGIDVPAADLAIILAGSHSRRQMVQRMGRVLRRKPDGRRARFVIVGAEDTVEDPQRGAHEGFLDAVTDVADVVRPFPSTTPTDEIIDFLRPETRGGDYSSSS